LLILKLLIDLCLMPLPRGGSAEVTGIVRLDAIGDFVVWLPAAQALVQHLRVRNQRVVLVANHLWAAWAQTLLQPDQVVPIDMGSFGRSLKYRLETLRRIRRLSLGTIILPTYSRIPGDGNDAVAFASGARLRIANRGYRSKHRLAAPLRAWLNLGYSRIVVSDEQPKDLSRPLSEPEINANFVRGLGVPLPSPLSRLPVSAPSSAIAALHLPTSPYIVMIPGGSWSGKAWPVERFVEISKQLTAAGFAVVVAGSAGERTLCETLATASGGRNLAGQTSLQTLAEVIRGARLVIGNDSAGIHVAVAAGVDSVCVMWGGSFGRFIPYAQEVLPDGLDARAVYQTMDCFGCTGACPYPMVNGKVRCIDAVPVAQVWTTVKDLLCKRNADPAANTRPACES
jgi:ADP-heptose:LPS heptosyltransferase